MTRREFGRKKAMEKYRNESFYKNKSIVRTDEQFKNKATFRVVNEHLDGSPINDFNIGDLVPVVGSDKVFVQLKSKLEVKAISALTYLKGLDDWLNEDPSTINVTNENVNRKEMTRENPDVSLPDRETNVFVVNKATFNDTEYQILMTIDNLWYKGGECTKSRACMRSILSVSLVDEAEKLYNITVDVYGEGGLPIFNDGAIKITLSFAGKMNDEGNIIATLGTQTILFDSNGPINKGSLAVTDYELGKVTHFKQSYVEITKSEDGGEIITKPVEFTSTSFRIRHLPNDGFNVRVESDLINQILHIENSTICEKVNMYNPVDFSLIEKNCEEGLFEDSKESLIGTRAQYEAISMPRTVNNALLVVVEDKATSTFHRYGIEYARSVSCSVIVGEHDEPSEMIEIPEGANIIDYVETLSHVHIPNYMVDRDAMKSTYRINKIPMLSIYSNGFVIPKIMDLIESAEVVKGVLPVPKNSTADTKAVNSVSYLEAHLKTANGNLSKVASDLGTMQLWDSLLVDVLITNANELLYSNTIHNYGAGSAYINFVSGNGSEESCNNSCYQIAMANKREKLMKDGDILTVSNEVVMTGTLGRCEAFIDTGAEVSMVTQSALTKDGRLPGTSKIEYDDTILISKATYDMGSLTYGDIVVRSVAPAENEYSADIYGSDDKLKHSKFASDKHIYEVVEKEDEVVDGRDMRRPAFSGFETLNFSKLQELLTEMQKAKEAR